MASLALFWHCIILHLKTQMQYKASFIMFCIGNLLFAGMDFVGIAALFSRFGELQGWSIREIALFYGIVHSAFAITEFYARGFDLFAKIIRAGDFDRLLLRPQPLFLQIFCSDVAFAKIGRLLQGIAILAYACANPQIHWTIAKALLIPASIAGASAFFLALFVLQATLCFWTVEGLEIMNALTYGGVEVAQYPVEVFSKWIQCFFIYIVPLAWVTYAPAIFILGKNTPGFLQSLACLAPLAGFVFLALASLFWQFGR